MKIDILFFLNLLMTTIESATLLLLGTAFFDSKLRSWKLGGSFLLLVGLNVLALIFTSGMLWAKLGALLVISSVWLWGTFRVNIIKCIMIAALDISLVHLVDNAFFIGFQVLMQEPLQNYLLNPYTYYLFCYTAKCIELLCVVVIRLVVRRVRKNYANTGTSWIRTIMFPLASLLVAGLFLRTYMVEPNVAKEALTGSIILMVTDVLAIFLLNHLEEQQQAINDNIILRHSVKLEQDNISAWMTAYAGQRKQTHDFVNHLMVIRGLAKDGGATKELLQYVNQLLKTDFSSSLFVKTGRSVVDVIINQKYAIAQTKGIDFQPRLDDLTKFALPDDALVVVLANLIDNAIAACEKIENEEPRKILLKMQVTEDASILYIENTTALPVKILDNRIITSKKIPTAHGYGMKNITSILERYGAIYALTYVANKRLFYFSTQIPHS